MKAGAIRLPGNRRLHAAIGVLAAAVLVLLVVLLVRALGGDSPPTTRAAQLGPSSALVYVGLSTDEGRDAVQQALDLADRFSAFEGQRDVLLRRLSGAEGEVDAGDVEPWLGDEAALALVEAGTATAGSLVIIDVTDEGKARAFLRRNPREATRTEYKDHPIDTYGAVATTFVDGFLVIGQQPTVQAALDRTNDLGRSLDEDATFRAATRNMPESRFATAYASAAGLRRLLVPQGNLLGNAAVLLDQPALKGVGLALEAEEDAARLSTRSILDPARQRDAATPFTAFAPTLDDEVPEDALGYLGVQGISGALQRLVGAAAGGAGAGGLGPVLERLREDLEKRSGGKLDEDLLKLLRGESALVVTEERAIPVLSLVTRTEDGEGTRSVLARLREPIAKLLTPPGEQGPAWKRGEVEGDEAWTLAIPGGAGISYAVRGDRLIISSSMAGLGQIDGDGEPLTDTEAYEEVLGERPEKVRSVGFLDFSQLLELGEQTGLNDSRAYLAARDDLSKVRAVGVSSTGGEGETTSEILLSIP